MMKKTILFCITFLFICAETGLLAQNDSGSEVIVNFSPEIPFAGLPWTLSLLVDHSVPEEVNVFAPLFTGALFLDRVVKVRRIVEENAAPWTLVEYRFIPESAGRVTLEPFTVVSPAGTTRTSALAINVQRPVGENETVRPRTFWDSLPSVIFKGEEALLILRVTGLDSVPRPALPPADFFMPAIPRDVILEAANLSQTDDAGILVRLRIIPLEAGLFQLPARTLRYGNILFEIPPLRIQVNAPSAPAAENITEVVTPNGGKEPVQFPVFNPAGYASSVLLKFYQADCDKIYSTARGLWEAGCLPEALAELRRNERDHAAGALLRPVRREAEQRLGFYNTRDEGWGQKKLFLFSSIASLIFATILFFVCFRLKQGSFLKKPGFCVSFILMAAGFFCLYQFFNYSGGRHSRFGITRDTPVRRTPDYAGEQLFSFREGQPVRIYRKDSGSWLWVMANETGGNAGWIPADTVITY